jgi:hypothetical protein
MILALSADSGLAEPAATDPAKNPTVRRAPKPALQLKTETDLKLHGSESVPAGLTPIREPKLDFFGLNLTQPLPPK